MIRGLQGGHSGDDINSGRGNAVKLLTRILWNGYQIFDARMPTLTPEIYATLSPAGKSLGRSSTRTRNRF